MRRAGEISRAVLRDIDRELTEAMLEAIEHAKASSCSPHVPRDRLMLAYLVGRLDRQLPAFANSIRAAIGQPQHVPVLTEDQPGAVFSSGPRVCNFDEYSGKPK